MASTLEHLPKSTVKLTVTVALGEIKRTNDQVVADIVAKTKIKGFRKGKAPKEFVEKGLDQKKVRAEVLNRVLPQAYTAAVKEHNLQPIVNPKIEIKRFEENKDLIFEALTAERPKVELGDYRGKPLKTVLDEAKVEIPPMLIEEEINRMLSRLVDQTSRLGLTVEQYLASRGQTAEGLRVEYQKVAEENLKLEFVLDEIAKVEKIKVTDTEIEEAIKAAPDEKTRAELAKPEKRWYIRYVLRNQKVINQLAQGN